MCWKGNLICTNFRKFHSSELSHLDAMAANVNSGDFEDLRLVDRVRVATFREHDVGVEWVIKPWIAQHIKRSLHFVKTPWTRDPCDAAMSKVPIGMGGRTFSDESRRCDRQACREAEKRRVRNVECVARLIARSPIPLRHRDRGRSPPGRGRLSAGPQNHPNLR